MARLRAPRLSFCAVPGLQVKTVVPLLVTAHLHELGKLKQACIDLIKANMAKVMMSPLFISLKTQHPLLWRETQTALDAQDDGGEEEEGGEKHQSKYLSDDSATLSSSRPLTDIK